MDRLINIGWYALLIAMGGDIAFSLLIRGLKKEEYRCVSSKA